jgi:predicted MFS family arabinose efflux permease
MVMNSAHRMFYPFLPALSRGLGVEPQVLSTLLALRGAFGISAPVFGPIPERVGKRNALLIGVSIFCLGLSLAGLFPNIVTVAAAILMIILCKFIFDPALQAYLSERTPYAQRGLVIGLTEFGWSGAVLVGVPLAGWLIERGGWSAAFLPLAGAGLLAGVWIAFAIPADPPQPHHTKANGLSRGLAVLRHPAVVAALAVSLLASAANESLSVVYGQWLEHDFALPVFQLGLTTIVIGVSELIGEGGVAVLSDRLGKRRTLILGLILSALAYLLLPFISSTLPGALTGIFLVYLTFEFAIVASLPLISELLPESRNSVMSMTIASHSAGRMVGAQLGGFLFGFGFLWNGLVAGAMTLICILLIARYVRKDSDMISRVE